MDTTNPTDVAALFAKTTADVVGHIVKRHHAYAHAMITVLRPQLRRALAAPAAAATAAAAAERDRGLLEVATLFDELTIRLLEHQDSCATDVYPALLSGSREAGALAARAAADHGFLLEIVARLERALERATLGASSVAVGLRALIDDVRRQLFIEKSLVLRKQ